MKEARSLTISRQVWILMVLKMVLQDQRIVADWAVVVLDEFLRLLD